MSLDQKKYAFFRSELLSWYDPARRPLPWKAEKDPYLIWLSEIILQQTRVEQGLPYYNKFKKHYPSVYDLAQAPQDAIMKDWEGLGYYSRARNMHEAAKYVVNHLQGQFPSTYDGLLQLKGVGSYTAAAIASFAYNLPHAVLDGNVFRVLARFLGIGQAIDTTAGKKYFSQQASRLLAPNSPGLYNQAIMDFGATVCRPKKPGCSNCPMKTQCSAYQTQTIDQLPVKAKKIERQKRYFNFVILNAGNKVLIRKRTNKDIWRGLYEFPVIETNQAITDLAQLLSQDTWHSLIPEKMKFDLKTRSKSFQQTLTHQIITATFWEFDVTNLNMLTNADLMYIERKNLSNFAFPKIVDLYLSDNSLYLNLQ